MVFQCNESPSLVPRPSVSTKVFVCACVCARNTFTSCQSDSLISFCHSSSYAKENWTRCVALISLHGSPPPMKFIVMVCIFYGISIAMSHLINSTNLKISVCVCISVQYFQTLHMLLIRFIDQCFP